MTLIKLLLSLALPLYLGYCIVALIYKNKAQLSLLERFALSWGIGLGLLGIFMYTMSLLNIPLNFITIAIPIIIVALALTVYAYSKKLSLLDFSAVPRFFSALASLKPIQIVLVVLIGLTITYVFFDALIKPIDNFDDLWRQGAIAKIIYTSGKVLTEQSVELAGPHPYLNPLSQSWVYMALGTWNDALGKIVFALCFASLIFIFYSGLRRYTNRSYSLLFTYLLTAFPLIVYHAGTAYSDLMQTFYYATGIIFLFHWIKTKNNPDLYSAALFLGIGVFVKQLGTPLWLIAIVVLVIYLFFENNKDFKPAIPFLLVSTLVALPWLINKQSFLLNYLGIFLNKLVEPTNLGTANVPAASGAYGTPSLTGILYHLGRRIFTYADWQILWFTFIAAIILLWKFIWSSKLKYLLLIIAFDLIMVIIGFSGQATYNYLVDGTLVQRMLMYQVPVVLFFTALCLKNLLIQSHKYSQ